MNTAYASSHYFNGSRLHTRIWLVEFRFAREAKAAHKEQRLPDLTNTHL